MALKPKSRSGPHGSIGATIPALRDLPHSTRQRKPTESEYEKARIEEISRRAELYELRIARLKADLWNRTEVEREYVAVVAAIKQGIMQSRLTKKEREEVFANILTVAQFATDVTRAQQADWAKGEVSPVIGNNGIDQEL